MLCSNLVHHVPNRHSHKSICFLHVDAEGFPGWVVIVLLDDLGQIRNPDTCGALNTEQIPGLLHSRPGSTSLISWCIWHLPIQEGLQLLLRQCKAQHISFLHSPFWMLVVIEGVDAQASCPGDPPSDCLHPPSHSSF